MPLSSARGLSAPAAVKCAKGCNEELAKMSSATDARDVGRWPALLTFETACRYLSLDRAQFLAIAEKWKVMPIRVDGEELRWRQKDLNRMIDRLPIASEFSIKRLGAAGFSLDDATIDRLGHRHSDRS